MQLVLHTVSPESEESTCTRQHPSGVTCERAARSTGCQWAPDEHGGSHGTSDTIERGRRARQRAAGPCERVTAEALNHQLVARALALGGTSTGEHGVGVHKMGFLVDEAGEGAVAMMRAIKQALDPQNILNPGKIFAL